MDGISKAASRKSEVWRLLSEVNDPELDEPVTDMGFVERVAVSEDGGVEVDFRLPTYWCSPNFAFLMLDGMRLALEQLPWAPTLRISLHDHLFADEVNKGLEAGKPFSDIFSGLAPEENLDELRRKFQRKAFERRQEAVLLALREEGREYAAVLELDARALETIHAGTDLKVKLKRYCAALRARFPDLGADARAFRTWEGEPLEIGGLSAHLAKLRSVRINMEFNGALCRGLKQTRYKEKVVVDGEPTLIDFMLDRVPRPIGDAAPSSK